MRSALIFVFLIISALSLKAQSDDFEQNLQQLKQHDQLDAWLTESIEQAERTKHFELIFKLEKQFWRAPKTVDEKYAYLNLLCIQGYYYLQFGQIVASINRYEKAYEYYRTQQLARFDAVEYVLKPLSNNYTRLGDYDKAIFLQEKAIRFLEQTHASQAEIVAMYGNLAISYRSIGQLQKAIKCINQALTFQPNSQQVIILNNILANVFFDGNDLVNAKKSIDKNLARNLEITSANAYTNFGTFTTAGTIYSAMKYFSMAESYFKRALSIRKAFFKNERFRETANVLTQLGEIYSAKKDNRQALDYFERSLTIWQIFKNGKIDPQAIIGENKQMEAFCGMADVFADQQKIKMALAHYDFALMAGTKIRNEFADDNTKQRLQANLKVITEKALNVCYTWYKTDGGQEALLKMLQLIEGSKARTLLDRIRKNKNQTRVAHDTLFNQQQQLQQAILFAEKQALESKNNHVAQIRQLKYDLAMIDKKIASISENKWVVKENNVEKLLQELPDQTIINYFVGEEKGYAVLIRHKKPFKVYQIANTAILRQKIKWFVGQYFSNGAANAVNDPQTLFQTSNQLYQSVLAPLEVRDAQIMIVPDDVLGYLSFDGLITNNRFSMNMSKWPFAIKRHIFSYGFSLNAINNNKPSQQKNSFYATFITHQGNTNLFLPATESEAKNIKKLLNGKVEIADAIEPQALENALAQNSLVHLGTHAYLTGEQQEPTLNLGKKQLFLLELKSAQRMPNLVVLDACRTADGKLANGEGIISFSRGFAALGVPATIAGLWNVNDFASSIIMTDFYRQLKAKNNPILALREAKLQWLNTEHNNIAFYLPYYWDSLVYTGTPQTIVLSTDKNLYLFIGFAIALLICSGAFLLYKRKNMFKRRLHINE